MTIVISAAAQQAMLNALTAQIDGGSGDPTGDILFLTSTDVPVGTVIFQNPSFQNASGTGPVTAVQQGATITTAIAPTAGLIAKGQFRNRTNTTVVSFAVAVGGGDLSVGTIQVPLGASSIDISGLTITLTVV